MTQAGNEEFSPGANITCNFQDSTDSEAGDGVYVSGHDGTHTQVQLADNTNGVHGIIEEAVASGEYSNVHFDGAVWARVAAGDDAAAGETVGTDSGMVDGELTDSGSDYLVLEGETSIGGVTYALVHLTANAV